MIPFDGCPRRPARTSQASPARRKRENLCQRTLHNGHVRTISYLSDERGDVLCSGVFDGVEYYGRIFIFPKYARMVLDACTHALRGSDGRRPFGEMSSTAGTTTIAVYGRVSGDHRAVVMTRTRDGKSVGGNLTFVGDELVALAKGCEMLLSAETLTPELDT
jgi:hypothetical protein